MGISVRLRDFPVLVLVVFGLLVFAPRAHAGDTLVLNQPLPTLRSLVAVHHASAAATATVSAEPICDLFANGYEIPGATVCAGCFDGTVDFDETDIDCGSAYCKACSDGQHCASGSDCSSTVCNTETTVCAPATCANGTQDPGETGVDCGGGICPACGVGLGCSANADCANGICDFVSGVCVANLCIDQRQDGAETATDCGGGTCPTCGVGLGCSANGDCTSTACDFVSGKCVAGLCSDQRKDGNETDVDCGGGSFGGLPACPVCATGLKCSADTDCLSNACNANSPFTCVSNQCADNRKDGLETAIDCGGGTCSACGLGLGCSADADCVSNACDGLSHLCVVSQCSDNRKDGSETDIDCGGNTLTCATRCAVGKSCLANSDCTAGHTCNTGSHLCQ